MKAIFKTLCAFAFLALPIGARAQCPGFPTTPNLQMGLPSLGATANWGGCINSNLATLDSILGGSGTLGVNSATPSVAGHQNWVTANTSATTITNFLNGFPGQTLHVLCTDVNTTIANNSSIFITAGVNFTCSVNSLLEFVLSPSNVWVQITTTSSVSVISPVNSPNPFVFNIDTIFKGPNPEVSIAAYGARAGNPNTTPYAVGLTANCNSVTNPAQVTISNASTFKNGDGVVLYGCGAPQSMSTPSGLSVTPSVARLGTATGIVATGPTGSATYNYKIIARDKFGGLTAASATASTTTGAASLGAQTVNIISISAVNDTFTVTTSAAHGFNPGCNPCGEVFIGGGNGITDVRFRGWWPVNSVADSTHFTIANIFFDTRNGASTSATGGTATWYNCNHLSWSAVTGAWNFYIYSDRANPGTFVLVGTSRPQGTQNTDLTFDDFGSPFMDNQVFPPYVPANPPVTATSDHLSTTIASGAGTTALTLANAAGTTVSGATIRLDAGPAIVAAATAAGGYQGGIFIPSGGGNQFVVNSYTLVNQNVAITQSGTLYLNETLEYSPSLNGSAWSGDKVNMQFGTSTVTQWHPTTTINVNTANPGVYVGTNNGGFYFSGISFVQVPNNGALQLFVESGFNQTFEKMLFSTTQNGNFDFLGIGLYQRGKAGVGSATNIIIDQVGFAAGGVGDGADHTPIWYVSDMGNLVVRSAYFVHRGAVMAIDPSGGGVNIQQSYINGGIMPLYTISGGAASNGIVSLGVITMDTIAHPCLAAFGSNLGSISGGCAPSSGVSEFTGIRAPTPGSGGGNRDSSSFSVSAGAKDGVFNSGPWSNQSFAAALSVGNNYPIFVNNAVPAQPTCSVSAGGSLAVGGYQFTVVPLWQNNGEGIPAPISAVCTTTTGNQTITINWTAVSGNPKGYDVYYCFSPCGSAGSAASNNFNNPQSTSATSLVFTANGFSAGVYNGGVAGGPTMLMPGTQGIATPNLITGALNATSINAAQVVGVGANTTIALTCTAAGTGNPVIIPSTYAGTDNIPNSCYAQVTDYRINAELGLRPTLRVGAVINTTRPILDTIGAVVPLGGDMNIYAEGAADMHIGVLDYTTTSSTSVAAPGVATITLAGLAPCASNPTGCFYAGNNTAQQLQINKYQSDFEALQPATSCVGLAAGFYCIASATTVTANFVNAHNSTPYTVGQRGIIFLHSPVVQTVDTNGTTPVFSVSHIGTSIANRDWQMGRALFSGNSDIILESGEGGDHIPRLFGKVSNGLFVFGSNTGTGSAGPVSFFNNHTDNTLLAKLGNVGDFQANSFCSLNVTCTSASFNANARARIARTELYAWLNVAGSDINALSIGASDQLLYYHNFNGATTTLQFPAVTGIVPAVPNTLMSVTAPTIAAAGCGGGAAAISVSNGTAAFKINVGTTPGSACTFTMPAATTGWNASCNDITTQSTSVFLQKQTGAESTTSVTITNFNDVAVATAFVASDILKCTASAD